MRQGENDMEILDGEQFGLALLYPADIVQPLAFWAVAVAARVITVALIPTGIALLNMTTEYGGTTIADRVEYAMIEER